MNTFGTKFKVTIFGESHGTAIGVVLDGVPAGVPLCQEDFNEALSRRRNGQHTESRVGLTNRTEKDELKFISGLYNGFSTGGALTIMVENKDLCPQDYTQIELHPRPSHADLVMLKKHCGYNDPRGGGNTSGRMTVGLVIAGVVAAKLLPKEIEITAKVTEIGGEKNPENWTKLLENIQKKGNSIGGIVECVVSGVKIGVGEPFFNSLESVIAHLLFSIPAIKGVEFGSGFNCANMTGTEHNDLIINHKGDTKTNHSGGIVGGISNGNPLKLKVAVKPTPSIAVEQQTMKFKDKNITQGDIKPLKIKGRHDNCIALRVPVVVESCLAIALVNLN